MSNLTNAVCFTCGLVIETPPRLTRLTNGQVCPACRERVLEGLPPALPSRAPEAASSEPASARPDPISQDEDDDSGPKGWGNAS